MYSIVSQRLHSEQIFPVTLLCKKTSRKVLGAASVWLTDLDCILVQSRIEGYIYNIVSETKYNEQTFPATPPREREPSPPIQPRPASARAIIDERPAQRPFAQQGTAYRIDRPLVSSRAGDRRGVFRQSSNPQVTQY